MLRALFVCTVASAGASASASASASDSASAAGADERGAPHYATGMAHIAGASTLERSAPDQPHLKDALPHLRLACRLSPSNADYLNNLGVAEMRLGMVASAKKRFVRALKLAPAHAGALANIAWARDLQTEADAALWDGRHGGAEEYAFGELRQNHTLLELPRIAWADFGAPRWEEHRNGKRPFILTGLLTPENGWDLPGFWRKAALTALQPDAMVDFYPHNMGDEKVYPLFSSLQEAWGELDAPTRLEESVDASQPGTYIQWNVLPAAWERLAAGIGTLPQLATLDDAWLPHCFPDAPAREKFFRSAHWRMLLIGERGAGMFNHKDTLRVSSWQAQVQGRKRWHLCEGDSQDDFMYQAGDVNSFAPDYEKYPLFRQASCYQAEVAEGEFIFYPRDWWHQTQNLEQHTMSLSGSIVDAINWETSAAEFRHECAHKRIMYPDEDVCEGIERCVEWWEERFGAEGADKELAM